MHKEASTHYSLRGIAVGYLRAKVYTYYFMLYSHSNHTLLYARHPFWQPKYGYHALPRASYAHRSFLMAYLIQVILTVVQRAGSPVASRYALCWSVVASRGVLARAR